MESDAAARGAVVVVHALGDTRVHLLDVEATVAGLVLPQPIFLVGLDAGGRGDVPVGRVEGGVQRDGGHGLDGCYGGGGGSTAAHLEGLCLRVGDDCGGGDDGRGGNVDDFHGSIVADDRSFGWGTCNGGTTIVLHVGQGGGSSGLVGSTGLGIVGGIDDVDSGVGLAGNDASGRIDISGEGSGGHVGRDGVDAAGSVGVVEFLLVGGLAEDARGLSGHVGDDGLSLWLTTKAEGGAAIVGVDARTPSTGGGSDSSIGKVDDGHFILLLVAAASAAAALLVSSSSSSSSSSTTALLVATSSSTAAASVVTNGLLLVLSSSVVLRIVSASALVVAVLLLAVFLAFILLAILTLAVLVLELAASSAQIYLLVVVAVAIISLLLVGSGRGDVIGLHSLLRRGLGSCGEGEKDEDGGGGELDHDDFSVDVDVMRISLLCDVKAGWAFINATIDYVDGST